MNLFRSEEHIRKWSGFKPDTEEGIISLLDMAKGFSENLFARRMDADYVSHMQEYMMEGVKAFSDWGSFWQLPDA